MKGWSLSPRRKEISKATREIQFPPSHGEQTSNPHICDSDTSARNDATWLHVIRSPRRGQCEKGTSLGRISCVMRANFRSQRAVYSSEGHQTVTNASMTRSYHAFTHVLNAPCAGSSFARIRCLGNNGAMVQVHGGNTDEIVLEQVKSDPFAWTMGSSFLESLLIGAYPEEWECSMEA